MTALDASAGEWMVVWDIDDLYFPDRLEQINESRLEGYDFCCSYAVVVTNELKIKGVRGFHPKSFWLPRYFVHHTLGCRMEIARKIGYDPKIRVAEDATITWALDDNYRGRYIDEALTIYQEDAEVNLEKAIACNLSQLEQLHKMYEQGLLKSNAVRYSLLRVRWAVKLAVLKMMRISPSLYSVTTVRLRSYGQTAANWRLGRDRLAFINRFRSVD